MHLIALIYWPMFVFHLLLLAPTWTLTQLIRPYSRWRFRYSWEQLKTAEADEDIKTTGLKWLPSSSLNVCCNLESSLERIVSSARCKANIPAAICIQEGEEHRGIYFHAEQPKRYVHQPKRYVHLHLIRKKHISIGRLWWNHQMGGVLFDWMLLCPPLLLPVLGPHRGPLCSLDMNTALFMLKNQVGQPTK